MHEQLYLAFGEAISQLTGRTLAKLHPSLGVKVSPYGEVFLSPGGNRPARWTFGCRNNKGYRQVTIGVKVYYVHRLVAETFIQYPIPEGYQIDHISRDKSANMVSNLRIVTRSENQRNTSRHDRVTEQGRTHWYEDKKQANREWRARYYAENRDKVRERHARYKAEHPEKVREQKARYYAEHPEKVHEQTARYRAKHPERVRESSARYKQAKRKTHRRVRFTDGSEHWLPLEEAIELLKLPLSERIYKENGHA